jgi:SPP1 family predicted phage head-tail adaptor
MRAGLLDRQITIQRVTEGPPNDYGTPSEAWVDLATVRAQQVQTSTTEYIQGYGASDKTVIVFRTWWIDGITNADRVMYGDVPLNIKETKEIGRRNGLELRCEVLA